MVITKEFHEEDYDPVQLELMEERLIVLDNDDNPIGQDSKKICKSQTSHLALRLCTS